jgi:uncharacterized protein YndB with AHSA1/START domain
MEIDMRLALACAAFLALVACATAATPPAATIEDSSFVEADGTRSIQMSMWLHAAPARVYRAITTVDGWKGWAVPSAFGAIKLHGELETSYDVAAKAGDPANIKQQFLAVVPDRLLVFHTIQTPPGFPHAELFKKTVTSLHLASEAGGTRLVLTHQGFGSGPGFDQLYGFFADGDRQTLEALQKFIVE